MAKTLWVDGSNLTPAQMILFHGNNAATGHVHDGANLDGSVPKVNLAAAAHVTGLLPLANVADITTGQVNVKITNSYLTVQQTAIWVYMVIANHAYVYMNPMLGTSNSVDLEVTPATTWPAVIVPTVPMFANATIHNNSQNRPGMIVIPNTNSANWEFNTTDGSGDWKSNVFAASNNKGILNYTVTYYLG